MTFLLLDTNGLFKSVRNKLLESGKEPVVVVALWIICPDPRSIDETVEYMPLQQCFHLLLELHAELIPVTLVLSMDQKSGEKVDVLDVQPTTTACEQIAATVIKRQLGLDETILARSLPPIKISVEVSLCVIEYQASPAWVVWVFRKGYSKASVLQFLPTPPLTPGQVELLKHDNVVSAAAEREGRTLDALGIEPASIAAIVPTYLRRFRS